MLRIVLGVIAGFVGWIIVFIGSEKILSVIWPVFGVNQKAFEEAVKNGGSYKADTAMLLMQLVLGLVVSLLSGTLAAFVAGDNAWAPLFAGILLSAMGIMKAVMSWHYVPMWYHLVFTAMLLPMAIVGGKLIAVN